MLQRIVVILSLSAVSLGCVYNAEDKRAHCDNFEQLTKAGEHKEWEKLNVIGNGDKYVKVVKNLFTKVPNVRDLQLKNYVFRIETEAFLSLPNLHELHLDDNKLGRITARSFENPTMEIIFIYSCRVTDIQPRAFENVPNLKYILIHDNAISTIRKDVFNNNGFKHVNLRKNKIQNVEPGAFEDLPNLEFLSLEENELLSFDPTVAIGYNPSLHYLYVNRNQLTEIPENMFQNIPNVQILLLNINKINHIGHKVFAKLKNLLLLDLSNNQIEEIRPDIFPAKDGLISSLFLHENKLTYISSGVLVRLPKLRQISATGNPWQCPCQDHFRAWLYEYNITRICDKEVKDGQRPSCVIHPRNFKECVYDLENSREVADYYYSVISEYPVLPPVCNIDGVDKPTLGA